MNSIRRAAKIISPRSSVTSTPVDLALGRTTAIITSLNSDGMATVQLTDRESISPPLASTVRPWWPVTPSGADPRDPV